jgi:DNA-binding NtrC family response regulator
MLRPGRLLALLKRTFTPELSPVGSPRADVEYDYVGRQPAPTTGLPPASHAALWAAHSRDLYAETHRELDRLLLPRVLDYTGGNQHRAALLLGIARKTLRTKLRELGLRVAHSVEADEDYLP